MAAGSISRTTRPLIVAVPARGSCSLQLDPFRRVDTQGKRLSIRVFPLHLDIAVRRWDAPAAPAQVAGVRRDQRRRKADAGRLHAQHIRRKEKGWRGRPAVAVAARQPAPATDHISQKVVAPLSSIQPQSRRMVSINAWLRPSC